MTKRIKTTLLTAFVTLVLMNSALAYSVTQTIEIIPSKITIQGTVYDNKTFKYPIVLVDGMVYYPLTWEFIKVLGFTSSYTPSNGLSLSSRSYEQAEIITSRSFGPAKITKTATAVNYKITLDGKALVSTKPVLNFSGVTYVPLDFTPALRVAAHYSMDKGLVIAPAKSSSALPKAYNTYEILDSTKLIRNQGSASTCWAFAANTLFEIAIAKETGIYNDFSEDHLITNAPIPSTYNSGGNFLVSSIYYQNKLGPVKEQLAPINSQSKGKVFAVDYTLLSYGELNQNLKGTKQAILDKGAVLTSIYLNEEDKSVYNTKTASYYNSKDSLQRTHELVLVGWDDDYSKENFVVQPKENGAFIAQNSFGNSWGKEGFFYISYNDVHILDQIYTLADFEKNRLDTLQYYYDTTGMTHFESFDENNVGVGINNFKTSTAETLKRISLYTPEENMEVDVYYGSGSFSMALSTPKYTLNLAHKGYHTVDLPISMPLNAKSDFWIAVKYTGHSPFLVPIESPYPGIGYSLSANKGEGYIGNGVIFQDLTTLRARASIALRATTKK